MKKFFQTIKNIFSIEELKTRILNTLGFLIIFRLGSFVTLPGVDPTLLNDQAGGIFGLLNTFLGGAFLKASVFWIGHYALYLCIHCVAVDDGSSTLFSKAQEGRG